MRHDVIVNGAELSSVLNADTDNPRDFKLIGDGQAGTLVICPATAVPARFYQAFADAAVADGFEVLLFDYRTDVRYLDWMLDDIPQALRYALDHSKTGQVFAIGHSVGGTALGLDPVWSELSGAIRVGAASGYIWKTKQPIRTASRLLIYSRALTTIFGYAPKQLTGLGVDLSREQVSTWARFCSRPGFYHSEGLAAGQQIAIEIPVMDVYAEDDPYVTEKTRADLDRFYTFTNHRTHELGKGFGHVGFFRATNAIHWRSVFDFFRVVV